MLYYQIHPIKKTKSSLDTEQIGDHLLELLNVINTNEVANEATIKRMETILAYTVGSLNSIAETIPNRSQSKRYRSYEFQTGEADTLNQLLAKIAVDLRKLEALIRPQIPINQIILNELEQRFASNQPINPTQITKILSQFKIPGVHFIEFKNMPQQIIEERLEDIDYPLEMIPETYLCKITTSIMSDPCLIGPEYYVDRLVINQHEKHPITRAQWPKQVSSDLELSSAIHLFVKKAEWLYFAYNDSGLYKTLYQDKGISASLYKKELSYEDFCLQTKVNHSKSVEENSFVFFNTLRQSNPFSTRPILDLFAKYKLNTLYPSATEYEKLIRRMAVYADHRGLEQLTKSPVMDVVDINIYALNNEGKNSFTLIDEYQKRYPQAREHYLLCQTLLEKCKKPLAIKKLEWIGYEYQDNNRCQNLADDETIQGWWRDNNLSYQEFCQQVKQRVAKTNHFVFFNPSQENNPIPGPNIRALLTKYQIQTARPGKEDYEKLIRRIAVKGNDHDLGQLLASPILDVVPVQVLACNDKDQNALDLISEYSTQYPQLSSRYALCQQELEKHVCAHNIRTVTVRDEGSSVFLSSI